MVTRSLELALEALDREVIVEQPLDPAEGPERLARHAMEEIRRSLSDNESADEQARRVNAVLGDLVGESWGDGAVVRPPRVLATRGRAASGAQARDAV